MTDAQAAEMAETGIPFDAVIEGRRSIRAFMPTPVPHETIAGLLRVASRAPSGTNTQPWHVHVLTGDALAALSARLTAAFEARQPEAPEHEYYLPEWRSPYTERRRATGWGLYALAGVAKGDREGSARQHGLNYRFFGAPMALIFTIEADMGRGSWLDYGMFLQNIMLAARARGLDTCPQVSIASYPAIVRDCLGLPDTQSVLCGMAIGHADPAAPVNRLVTAREPLEAFATFHG